MAGRLPILEHEELQVYDALPHFSLRDQALIVLGLNTGFRIHELLSLTVGQVWEQGAVRPSVTVTRARLKGGRSAYRRTINSRTVPLNDRAKVYLSAYLSERALAGFLHPTDPLFASRKHGLTLTRWQANRIVHAVLAAAGFADHSRYGTHTLRKTFCQKVYRATKHDINLTRAVMGHTQVGTTQRYLHVDARDVAAAVLAVGDSALPPSRAIGPMVA
jgi:integrase